MSYKDFWLAQKPLTDITLPLRLNPAVLYDANDGCLVASDIATHDVVITKNNRIPPCKYLWDGYEGIRIFECMRNKLSRTHVILRPELN